MENKKFRAALFMLPLLTQGGGAEKYFIDLARNFRERGIEADVVTMDEIFFRKFARLLHIFALGNFFGKIDIRGRESENDIARQLGGAQWIKSSLKDLENKLRNYDIIYSKNELVELILLKRISYKRLPPLIVGVHTPICYPEAKSFISKLHNFLYSGFLYRWLLKGARCVHVSNESATKIIEDKFKIKSRLVYYPFSVERISELARENRCNIEFDADKKNIIFIGRLGEQKGIDVLIKIIERIIEDASLKDKVSINIFGSGDKKYENEIRSLAEKYPFVRYFGHVEHKYMPDILSKQNLMIAPYRWETLPFTILEAQAMDLPVVTFDIPGPSDIIENNRTGFLARNEGEFFDKIKDISEGKVNFNRDAIIRNIEEKFGSEKIYDELVNMFQENL